MISDRNKRRLARRIAGSRPVPQSPLSVRRQSVPLQTSDKHPAHFGAHLFSPAPYNGRLFLYLGERSFADTWLDGGSIPLFPARKYLSEDRAGIYTPDEIHQLKLTGGLPKRAFGQSGLFNTRGQNVTLHFENCAIYQDDVAWSGSGSYTEYEDEAYLLCLACAPSADIMQRLGKSVCIEILDIASLADALDQQLGCRSERGRVTYTAEQNRGHFLKSEADAWQEEYRLVWRITGSEPKWATVPAGSARLITL